MGLRVQTTWEREENLKWGNQGAMTLAAMEPWKNPILCQSVLMVWCHKTLELSPVYDFPFFGKVILHGVSKRKSFLSYFGFLWFDCGLLEEMEATTFIIYKNWVSGLPKNPPANAGDMGSSPGPGRSHMPQSN